MLLRGALAPALTTEFHPAREGSNVAAQQTNALYEGTSEAKADGFARGASGILLQGASSGEERAIHNHSHIACVRRLLLIAPQLMGVRRRKDNTLGNTT